MKLATARPVGVTRIPVEPELAPTSPATLAHCRCHLVPAWNVAHHRVAALVARGWGQRQAELHVYSTPRLPAVGARPRPGAHA